ncbi:MAG: Low iron-inducible periplasmic protein-domain-containing protein [Monoraphidium minutum]|nr:MAG: Low iron-inducible periplasmic protein-domain-containing protein [Monoraphidium minutum]
MRTSGVFLLAAVAALALVASTGADTTGTTLRGFTFTSDVSPYLNISRDICDIKTALNNKNPDYTFAKGVYMDGFNAKMASKDGGFISMRRMVTDSKVGEPFWTMYQKHFNNPVWMDDLLVRAFSGIPPYDNDIARVQLIVKTLESSMQSAYMMHELDAAIERTKAGKKGSGPDGALYSLDKAWAIFVGEQSDCGLWTVSMKRANEYGTKKDCDTSMVAFNILTAMKAAQTAVKAGDVKALTAARNKVQSQLAAMFIQATIKYANEMYLDKLSMDKLSLSNRSAAEHQVEAFAFYRSIAPLVHAANETAGQALDFWLFPGQPVVDNVDLKAARAFNAAYKGLGVTPKDIGEFGKKQPALNCKAYVPTPPADGILSSSDAKTELRPGTAAPKAAAPKPKAAPKPPAAPKPAGRKRFFFFF